MKKIKARKKNNASSVKLPLYCDYSCEHAKFAVPDAVGACRRDQAVYCIKYKKHNNKNSNCLGRK